MNSKRLKDLLWYDEESGFFVWKVRGPLYGEIAGHEKIDKETGKGYVTISVDGKAHYAHRLAWLYMTDCNPPAAIDHINGDGTDNSWANLRNGTKGVNGRNRAKSKNNSSGTNGVFWHEAKRKWCAILTSKGKRHFVGLFDDVEDAAKAVQEKKGLLGFSQRHGD